MTAGRDRLSATNTPGFIFNNLPPLGNSGSEAVLVAQQRGRTQGLSNFAVGRSNNELGFGGLVLSASSESVSFLLRALERKPAAGRARRPQVTTLDNQPAFIQVGQRVPRITQRDVTDRWRRRANSRCTSKNVGLILLVTPRISPDGLVVMDIDAERSEVGPGGRRRADLDRGHGRRRFRLPRINTHAWPKRPSTRSTARRSCLAA